MNGLEIEVAASQIKEVVKKVEAPWGKVVSTFLLASGLVAPAAPELPKGRATTMHLWLLLSAALAFVPQRSVPAIRGLQAVVEDIDALSFRELQAACKERGLPARGATDVLRERLREHLADAPSDTDAIDLDAALAADDETAFAEEELIAPDAEADDDDAFAAQLDALFAEDDDDADADDAAESARRALKAARAPGPAAAAWAELVAALGGAAPEEDDATRSPTSEPSDGS